jgi:hypothetical protein
MTGQVELLVADSCGGLMPNPDALPPPRPRAHQATTSQLAADSIVPVSGELRQRVLAAISSAGAHGRTDDEGEVATGLAHQTYSARRRELAVAEAIRKNGERRPTRSGRTADVWVVA